MESPFEDIKGVKSVISGYAGGEITQPSYKQVSSGKTRHREVVQITYDENVISYEELLKIYWMQFDPTDEGGSFYDRGFQYSSAVFYHSEQQKQLAEASKWNWNNQSDLRNQLLHRLSHLPIFTLRKIIIKIITKPILSITNAIAKVPDAMHLSKSIGAM